MNLRRHHLIGPTGAAFAKATVLIAGLTRHQRVLSNPGPDDLTVVAAAAGRHLAALTELGEVLHDQVARADRYRVLRTDDGTDPAAVLDRARADAAALHASLSSAQMFAVSVAAGLGHLSGTTPPGQRR